LAKHGSTIARRLEQWPRLLAYITGRVDKELLVNEDPAAPAGSLKVNAFCTI